ncbi:hypothetical protein WJX82_007004 [Trebouxia sp. C0006]
MSAVVKRAPLEKPVLHRFPRGSPPITRGRACFEGGVVVSLGKVQELASQVDQHKTSNNERKRPHFSRKTVSVTCVLTAWTSTRCCTGAREGNREHVAAVTVAVTLLLVAARMANASAVTAGNHGCKGQLTSYSN